MKPRVPQQHSDATGVSSGTASASPGMPRVQGSAANAGASRHHGDAVVTTVAIERRAHDTARGHAVVASLGQRALAGAEFPLLLEQTVSLLAETLRVDVAAVCELVTPGQFQIRAAHGLIDGAGSRQFSGHRSRFPAAALASETPLCDGIERLGPAGDGLLNEQGLTDALAMRIPGRHAPYGVLLLGARGSRTFSREEQFFVHAVANIIGAASERAAMDRDLRHELALNAATIEAAAVGILVTDEEGRVTRFNQRAIEMFSPSAAADGESWLGWGVEQCLSQDIEPEDPPATAGSEQPARIHLKDGRVFEQYSRPQRVDGRIVGRVFSLRDITERLKADDERRALERQMLHVQKLESLGVLAGGIAHDFNNLLVSVLGNACLALADLEPQSTARRYLTDIERAAQQASDLTQQMLAYAGKGQFTVQRVAVSSLVDEVVTLLRSVVSRTADLDVRLTGELPAVEGDPVQLRQVVMNLVTNASDAIGGAAGRIEVTTGRVTVTPEYLAHACVGHDLAAGECVYVEVSDTGCGMDDETLARIFDPFFTTKVSGRGLGLAAVLGIVRSHHGAIVVESRPGVGTRFRLVLPIAADQQPTVSPACVATPRPVATGRVLVIDDDNGVRTVATRALERAGFEVVAARDGEEGVEMVRADGRFDAVLLDMTMPRLTGVDTCRAIKQLHPDLPIVLTSGYAEPEALARFDRDALAGFLRKPFTPTTLVKAVDDAISIHQRHGKH